MKCTFCLYVLVLATAAATKEKVFEKTVGQRQNTGFSKLAGSDTSAKRFPGTVTGQKTLRGGDDYVTQDDLDTIVTDIINYIDAVAMDLEKANGTIVTTMSMLDQTNTNVKQNTQDITDNYNELTAVDSSLSKSVGTLQDQYNTATVRMCKSGVINNACGSHCNSQGQHYPPNGVEHHITFDPPFHTTPVAMTTLKQYDDAGTSYRFVTTITPSASEMTITFKTWSSSRAISAKLVWIACA